MKFIVIALSTALAFTACSSVEPEAVKLNTDNCDYCKMTIADLHFASELITDKGKVYKFDDLSCMLNYNKENNLSKETRLYVSDFSAPTKFIDAKTAWYALGEQVSSPMGGNMAAFSNQQEADVYAKSKTASLLQWNDLH